MTRLLYPTKGRVVITEKEGPDMTPSGIILPDSMKREPGFGIVREIGEGVNVNADGDPDQWLEVDDEIVYAKYAGTEAKIEGTVYIILDSDDILAVVQEVMAGVNNEPVEVS